MDSHQSLQQPSISPRGDRVSFFLRSPGVVLLWTRLLVVLVGLRQSVGCRPLDGDWGVELDIPLGILLMIFVDLVGLSRRLPFQDGRRDMTRIILHDWRRVIGRQSIRVSRLVVSQMGVVAVPQCVPSSSYRIWGRMVRGS